MPVLHDKFCGLNYCPTAYLVHWNLETDNCQRVMRSGGVES